MDLAHNQIHTVDPTGRAFVAQKNLHLLDLSHNHLEILGHQTLTGLDVLHTLSLEHNKLHSMHPSSLTNCTVAIQELTLNNNFLTEIPKAVHFLGSLRSLDLSANLIGVLKRESLQGLPKLKALKISQNELSRYDYQLHPLPKIIGYDILIRIVLQIKTDLKFTDKIRYFDELEKKIKIKFTGISELDLSFQLKMM